MRIFSCYWAQDDCFGLNAVVIAADEAGAWELLELDESDTCRAIKAEGEAYPGAVPSVLAKESL